MKLLDLPSSARFERVIPKNAFDQYTSTREKKMFTDKILRITWLYKLSTSTVNLDATGIDELQIFLIELKVWGTIKRVLDIIDRAIPYHIIFVIQHQDEAYISTSAKHIQTGDADLAIIDHTFRSDWHYLEDMPYTIELSQSIDYSYKMLCTQLCDREISTSISLKALVEQEIQLSKLKHKVKTLQSQIRKCAQFNKKVDLNMELRKVQADLDSYYKQND